MNKKIAAFVLVTILVFTYAACGDNDSSQRSNESGTQSRQDSDTGNNQDSGAENVDDKTNNDDEMEAFTETLTFMGFNFNYPENWILDHYMYGYRLNNGEFFILLEAPSIAAIMLDLNDVKETPTAVEEYVIKTLETSVRALFNFDDTTQTITNSEVKSINDIEMLRVEGFFTNTRQDTEIPFIGYYFLRDNQPVYFVGVSLNEDVAVDAFMDEFAGYVEDVQEQLLQERESGR